MKIISSVFILTFGIASLGFAQDQKDRKLSIQDLKKIQPQLGDQIATIDFGKKHTTKLDTAMVFTPENFLLDREMYSSPSPAPNPNMPIYRFPDLQSRMPIERFDDSINYTIRIKKFH